MLVSVLGGPEGQWAEGPSGLHHRWKAPRGGPYCLPVQPLWFSNHRVPCTSLRPPKVTGPTVQVPGRGWMRLGAGRSPVAIPPSSASPVGSIWQPLAFPFSGEAHRPPTYRGNRNHALRARNPSPSEPVPVPPTCLQRSPFPRAHPAGSPPSTPSSPSFFSLWRNATPPPTVLPGGLWQLCPKSGTASPLTPPEALMSLVCGEIWGHRMRTGNTQESQ